MGLDATARRRWLGALALAVALAMLLAGQTVLENHLGPLGSLVYWLVCAGFTGVAILTAFLDVRALQNRSRKEQRELFHATLENIERDARKPPRRTGDKHPDH